MKKTYRIILDIRKLSTLSSGVTVETGKYQHYEGTQPSSTGTAYLFKSLNTPAKALKSEKSCTRLFTHEKTIYIVGANNLS